MSYTSIGAVSASSFSSSATLCKPTTAEARRAAEEFQRQLNRAAAAAKFAPITVDGVIGEKSVALANRILAAAGMWAAVTCTHVVGELPYWTGVFKTTADRNGVSETSASMSSVAPSLPGAMLPPPPPRGGIGAWLARRSLIEKVGIGVGGVVVAVGMASLMRRQLGGRR